MARKVPELDVDKIVDMYIVGKMSAAKIGKEVGVSGSFIYKVLAGAGTDTSTRRTAVIFTDVQKVAIFSAYDRGIGVAGIAKHIGIKCSVFPIQKVILEKYGKLRNGSEQQQARMDNSTPEQIAELTKKAHDAARGRKATVEERVKRAKTMEGKFNSRSKGEPIVFNSLVKAGFDPIASKAVHIYNADIMIGNIAIEVFGGGWSVTDKKRVAKYVERTKRFAEFGYHTIFVVLLDVRNFEIDKLLRSIQMIKHRPTGEMQYSFVWGYFFGKFGFASEITTDSFTNPTISVRDKSTGMFVSVPR